jgi:tetratricopeptide (TPR) repeat protein
MSDEWDDRVAAVWDSSLDDAGRIEAIGQLAAERPGEGRALFEYAGALDAAGREADAEPLYRQALAAGLDDDRRVQAVIQLASTIRNLGKTDESVALLAQEYAQHPRDGMRDAVAAFYALALSSAGDDRGALAIALDALAPHLPRYTRSVGAYAAALKDSDTGMPTANTAGAPEPPR